MKTPILALLLVLSPTLAAADNAAVPPLHSGGQSSPAGAMVIDHAWSRPTTPNAKMGVVYFKLTNSGSSDDTLTGVSTPQASKATLHESTVVNGVSKMRAVAEVPVKAGGAVDFAPGGMHVMLEGLKAPLTAGTSFPLTLTFAKAGSVTATVTVSAQGEETTGMSGMKM